MKYNLEVVFLIYKQKINPKSNFLFNFNKEEDVKRFCDTYFNCEYAPLETAIAIHPDYTTTISVTLWNKSF